MPIVPPIAIVLEAPLATFVPKAIVVPEQQENPLVPPIIIVLEVPSDVIVAPIMPEVVVQPEVVVVPEVVVAPEVVIVPNKIEETPVPIVPKWWYSKKW